MKEIVRKGKRLWEKTYEVWTKLKRRRSVNPTERMAVKFRDREMFGRFCVILASDHVPFQLAGFQTIVIARSYLDNLPPISKQNYETFLRDKFIEEVTPIAGIATGSRYLPNQQETERLLKELAEKY